MRFRTLPNFGTGDFVPTFDTVDFVFTIYGTNLINLGHDTQEIVDSQDSQTRNSGIPPWHEGEEGKLNNLFVLVYS